MGLPTPKELKALAEACRKAGITRFKCGEMEFDVAPKTPAKRTRKSPSVKPTRSDEEIETEGWDALSDEEKLLWSSAPAGMPLEPSQ